jgi:hypothetical protein
MRFRDEEGQAVIIVALAMSIFLIGAIGLGIDGAHLFAQRQMAQSAADAAAIAGITSVFNGTYSSGAAGFSTTSAFTCSTTDARTPCKYASNNGFGASADDTVMIDFPSSVPGIASGSLSPDPAYPVNLVRATVSRNVSTTLMRLLGSTATTVSATATAAIVYVMAPVPILVTHPTLANSFAMNGNQNVTICGGPSRSIQVNSNAGTANYVSGGGGSNTVDLSHAGPADDGHCTTGTGADFGTRGGPTSTYPPLSGNLGTTGHYVQPDLLMQDPLKNVPYPPLPTNVPPMGTHPALADGVGGCPLGSSPNSPCELYYPGVYTGDATHPAIDGQGKTIVLMPGIYYLQSVYASQPSKGFAIQCSSNCNLVMAPGAAPDTMTGTGWTNNVMFYNIGIPSDPTNAGRFTIAANGGSNLIGAPLGSIYKGILFFQNRDTVAQTHTMGGNGAMSLQGTIYLTNTIETMNTTPAQYQTLSLQGGSGSGTLIQGEIIVGKLSLGGGGSGGGITMNLNSNNVTFVSQIALVN